MDVSLDINKNVTNEESTRVPKITTTSFKRSKTTEEPMYSNLTRL